MSRPQMRSRALPPPTQLEQRLYRALERLSVRYIPEMTFPPFRTDAWLPGLGIAIEADGDWAHKNRACGFEDGADYEEAKRAYRDRVLLERYGVLCLHIWESDARTDEQMYSSLVAALRPYCLSAVYLTAERGESHG